MLNFPQIKKVSDHLYIEETDAPLPETLNPKTRYAFFSTLATGGKSLIQSCRDLHLRRTVCYKSLRSKYQKDPIENKRLLREARISAMLQHPNTIPAHEIGRDNRGNIYFTMKLVHGYTLREALNYRERYDLTQLMDVIIQIGNALAYAHSVGVLHRDIKPENILIGPYGEVLLLDWGLAKVWHENPLSIEDETEEAEETGNHSEGGMTGQANLQGTVMYMSPGQIDRDPEIGFQADIYSLGAVLYEVLTGSTPFQGNIVRVIMDQIRVDIPNDAKSVGGGAVPNVLADLAMRCLQKEPQNRPTSADEIVRILKDDWAPRDLT